jgi:hypothetical protein
MKVKVFLDLAMNLTQKFKELRLTGRIVSISN